MSPLGPLATWVRVKAYSSKNIGIFQRTEISDPLSKMFRSPVYKFVKCLADNCLCTDFVDCAIASKLFAKSLQALIAWLLKPSWGPQSRMGM